MLINLSNHPSNNWNKKQISKALKTYKLIIDIPFPKVPPNYSTRQVESIAKKYFHQCISLLSKSKDKNNAVHIMGEMNFCFLLITKLKAEGIKCIASTTLRNASIIEGKKVSAFRFVRFREY